MSKCLFCINIAFNKNKACNYCFDKITLPKDILRKLYEGNNNRNFRIYLNAFKWSSYTLNMILKNRIYEIIPNTYDLFFHKDFWCDRDNYLKVVKTSNLTSHRVLQTFFLI